MSGGGIYTELSKQVFRLGYEISPVVLAGESVVTQYVPGGLLPIIALTESLNFVRGLLSGGDNLELNDFFAHFQPLAGGTLIDNSVGTYPFANQSVAANAIVTRPLNISLRMICPARGPGAYLTKLATITALKTALDLHSTTGGTYHVATPAYLYRNCLLTAMRDITQSAGKQVQAEFQLDFTQPLLTLADAETAQNGQMARVTAQVPSTGASTGASIIPGASISGAAPVVQGAAQNLPAAGVQQGFAAPLGPVTRVPL